MEKVKTVVKIGGKEYMMAGYEPEDYIHKVAIYVDRKMEEIKEKSFSLSTTMIAVLSAVNIADELLKEKESTAKLQAQVNTLKEELRAARKDSASSKPIQTSLLGESKRNAKY